jgi:two-component system, LytTR family, response regulator
MTYKTLIVEDEKHQQEMLTELMNLYHSEFHVVGIASSITDARYMIDQHHPDLVFLDVHLTGGSTFDLLNTLPQIDFDIIFTTSYEQYALHAFRLSAVDYLLKPFGRTEIGIALEKFKEKKASENQAHHIQTLLDNLSLGRSSSAKIALPTFTGFIFVAVKDIVRCESDNTYTTFYIIDKRKIIVSRTLKECEQLLQPYNFYRVHNCHLINLDYISEYVRGEGGIVTMSDGSKIDVSRRRKEEFIRLLKKA